MEQSSGDRREETSGLHPAAAAPLHLGETAVRAALEARDIFLAAAAHELRTPITSLRGFAQLALRVLDREGGPDAGQLRLALRTIDEQSHRLAELVRQLLDVSRIDAGRLALSYERVDLVDVIRNTVRDVQQTSERHAIRVTVPARLVAHVDPLRVELALVELLDNAVAFAPAHTPIEVELTEVTGDPVAVARVTVRDRGPGVALEHRPHIFERFYRGHAGGGPPRQGLGLGLYLARQSAEMHGGELFAEWPPDGGSRFVLRVPVRPPEVE